MNTQQLLPDEYLIANLTEGANLTGEHIEYMLKIFRGLLRTEKVGQRGRIWTITTETFELTLQRNNLVFPRNSLSFEKEDCSIHMDDITLIKGYDEEYEGELYQGINFSHISDTYRVALDILDDGVFSHTSSRIPNKEQLSFQDTVLLKNKK